MIITVGIDVAKEKHDCFILSSEGEVLADVFTIQNNAEGFNQLFIYILNLLLRATLMLLVKVQMRAQMKV